MQQHRSVSFPPFPRPSKSVTRSISRSKLRSPSPVLVQFVDFGCIACVPLGAHWHEGYGMQSTRTHEDEGLSSCMGKRTTWNTGTLERRNIKSNRPGARQTCSIEKNTRRRRPSDRLSDKEASGTGPAGSLQNLCHSDVGWRAGGSPPVTQTQ